MGSITFGSAAGPCSIAARVSFADPKTWPDDGRRYELYDGEVYVVPSPLPLHQFVSARLHLALEDYVRAHGGLVFYAPPGRGVALDASSPER